MAERKVIHEFQATFDLTREEKFCGKAVERAEQIAGEWNRPGLGTEYAYAELPDGGERVTVTFRFWAEIPQQQTYQTEFPDFDPATLPEIPATWLDLSWRQDTRPTWQAARSARTLEEGGWRLYVGIDYLDPKRREMREIKRFTIWTENYTDDTNGDCLLETDDWAEILAALPRLSADLNAKPKAQPRADFWTWFDKAKAEAEATESGKAFLAAGFEFHTTGGCCTAWRLELRDGRALLVTDMSGTSVEEDDGWMLGLDGDDDGEEVYDFETNDLAGLLAKAKAFVET